MTRIMTDTFIEKIKKMTNYLYTINIDTDSEGRYILKTKNIFI